MAWAVQNKMGKHVWEYREMHTHACMGSVVRMTVRVKGETPARQRLEMTAQTNNPRENQPRRSAKDAFTVTPFAWDSPGLGPRHPGSRQTGEETGHENMHRAVTDMDWMGKRTKESSTKQRTGALFPCGANGKERH